MASLSIMDSSDGSSSNSENNLGDNIWYNKGVIKSATDTSDQTVTFPSGDTKKFDIAILLEIAIEGLQYPKKITVSGDFAKDHTGQITGWGGAFKVQKLLQAAVVKGELDNYRLTQEQISSLINKEVAFINYKKKDGKFTTWNRIYPVNAPKEVLKTDFKKDRARLDKGGWTNNYDSGDSLPNQINNGSTQEAWMKKDDMPQGSLSVGTQTKFMG
tara:strand:+ start:858 stop:1502 length:645 start_codon:yes stop_codon:yes gene_type:complete